MAEQRPPGQARVGDTAAQPRVEGCDWRSPASERLFRELSDLSPDWYWEQDAALRFSWVSPGYEKNAGRPPADVLGKTRWEAFNVDLEEPHWRAHFEILQRREPFRNFDFSFPGSDGLPRWTRVSGVPKFDAQGRFLGYRGVGRAMTERILAERALAQSEERFQDFARAGGDFLSEFDAEGRFVWVWESASASRGVPPGWYIGRRRTDLAAPGTDFGAEPWKSHLEALERHEPYRDFRYVITDPADPVVLSVSGVPYFDADGRFLGYRNVARDVAAQVRAEQRVHAADQRLRAAIEHLSETIVLTDAEDRIVMANRRFREMSGAAADCLEPGMPYESFLRKGLALGLFLEAVGREEDWLEERLARRRSSKGEFEQRYRGGRWLLVSDQHLPDGGIITYGLDITERKRIEEQRLEAARRQRDALIREVHHRIKNNLQGVVGLLKEHVYLHPQLAPVFKHAATQVQLVALVHGLQGQTPVGGVKVCELVPAIARNVESLTKAEIAVKVEVPEQGVHLAESESVAVALIVNELLFNAVKHAPMGQGVRIDVRKGATSTIVSIRNPGALAAGFDFVEGRGIGTGLELVRALVPTSGARLSIVQDVADVLATLELAPPVVSA